MKLLKKDFFLFLLAVFLGIIFVYAIYLLMAFVILFVLGTIGLLLLLITDWKDNSKMVFKVFLFGFTIFISSYLTSELLDWNYNRKANKLVSKIYEYKTINKKFPKTLTEVSSANLNANYVVDSTFSDFKLYLRGMYGIPKCFDSIDSTWALP